MFLHQPLQLLPRHPRDKVIKWVSALPTVPSCRGLHWVRWVLYPDLPFRMGIWQLLLFELHTMGKALKG